MLIDHVKTHLVKGEGQLLAPWALIPFHIFILVVKGGFLYQVGDETVELKEGSGIFIPQDSRRTGTSLRFPGPHQLYITYFRDVEHADLGALLDKTFAHFQFTSKYHYIRSRFVTLHEYWLGKPPGWMQLTKGIVMEMIGLLHGELADEQLSPVQRNLVQQVRDYIVQHYREPIRLQEIANKIDRSPAYVSSAFKQATGKSIMDVMHEVRISAARDLILNSNMSMEEVAEFLGYCNQTYFAQRYKRLMGYPPTHTLKLNPK
ncbi:AraC family transcriptional regulator [Paenibacillus hodogayensis]|uniref:AraC family transcriptional regulator n=1 Tax=Paenibacillus hodogayensis TaxID=279208 RepID=A0ABV5W0N1_9BACL